jgi:hypothetical protein
MLAKQCGSNGECSSLTEAPYESSRFIALVILEETGRLWSLGKCGAVAVLAGSLYGAASSSMK